MAEYRRSIDVYQGYNFREDKQTVVGFITRMKIGDADLAADQTCKDPTSPTKDLNVVGVMSGVLWETGVTDAVYLSAQISAANRRAVSTLSFTTMTSVVTVFQFTVYEYDRDAKKYFLAFHTSDADMNGILESRGEDLNVSVADDASTEVVSPVNYSFQIGIKPQASAQRLYLATAYEKNIVRSWGLAG